MKRLLCCFGFHHMKTREDATHIWGECIRCHKHAGIISRRSVRAYIEAAGLAALSQLHPQEAQAAQQKQRGR